METLRVELGTRSYRIGVVSHELGLGTFARVCAPRSTAADRWLSRATGGLVQLPARLGLTVRARCCLRAFLYSAGISR